MDFDEVKAYLPHLGTQDGLLLVPPKLIVQVMGDAAGVIRKRLGGMLQCICTSAFVLQFINWSYIFISSLDRYVYLSILIFTLWRGGLKIDGREVWF